MQMTVQRFMLRLAIALLAACASTVAAGDSFQLKISEGYRFEERKVVESGAGDLSFTYQGRNFGIISYLQAKKIKRFDSQPDPASLTRGEVESWEGYVAAPSSGYYVIRTSPGQFYLLHRRSFENQGKAASCWLMATFWPLACAVTMTS